MRINTPIIRFGSIDLMEQNFHVGVKALIKDSNGKILVAKSPSAAYWDIPGGRIEENEGIRDALLREIGEELGISEIEIVDLYDAIISKVKINTDNGAVGLCLLVYNCRLPKGVRLSPNAEHDEYKWIDGKSAMEFLSNKFPQEFLEKLSK